MPLGGVIPKITSPGPYFGNFPALGQPRLFCLLDRDELNSLSEKHSIVEFSSDWVPLLGKKKKKKTYVLVLNCCAY